MNHTHDSTPPSAGELRLERALRDQAPQALACPATSIRAAVMDHLHQGTSAAPRSLRVRFGILLPLGIAAALALAPSVYPWYLLWLTPFLFTPATRPLAVWTVTILPTYLVLYLERVHGTWELPWWLVAAEYGAVPAAAVVGLRFARVPDRTLEFGVASRSGGRTSAARRRVWSRWRGGRGG